MQIESNIFFKPKPPNFFHCYNYTPSNFETQISTVQPLPESHQRRLWTSPQLRMEVIDSSSKGAKATALMYIIASTIVIHSAFELETKLSFIITLPLQ